MSIHSRIAAYRRAKPILNRFLDTNGDGTGAFKAVGDYASAPTDFYVQPAPGEAIVVTRMVVYAEDTGGMDNAKYGNGITLTNGVRIKEVRGGVETFLDGGVAVKTNGQWKRLCYDEAIDSSGAGNDSMAARWTFAKSGVDLCLYGNHSDKLIVTLNDDFGGLIDHTFLVQGYYA